ncbi:MAG: D-alanyl-D-alanine carboxypeptidase/D-alanyl-D-alanine-endopeptidase [Acidimicrobiales bacterium]
MAGGWKKASALALAAVVLGGAACTSGTEKGSGSSATTAAAGGTSGSGRTGAITSVPGLDPSALPVMNQPAYAKGDWWLAVKDIDTGETLISYNADRLVEPGSVVKTYSSGAVWLADGPDSKLTTPVKRSGEVAGGTLDGDLVLVAQGDLTMGGRRKADGTVDFTNLDHNDANELPGATLTPEDPLTGLDQLAAQVKQSGITTISGNVVVDDRLWDPHKLVNGPVSPIIINENLIDFLTTPTQPGQSATIEMRPKVAPWTLDNQVQTVPAGGKTKIEVSSADEKTVTLKGTIAADSDPVVNVYAFKDPATFARTAFIEALQRAGVTVAADPLATNAAATLPASSAVEALPTVASLESLPLDQEALYVLKVSYNRGAETFICRLAVQAGSKDCTDGLAKAAELWKAAGLDTTGAALIDGSGLTGNLITPMNQADLQAIMAKRPDAARWKATLPILGVDGSLAMVQPDSPAMGKVFAKTGSLGAGDFFNDRLRLPTKALGGVMETAKGRKLAFAIVASNALFADINGVFAANDDVGKVAAIIQQQY